jgi:hypothetical protein
MPLQYFYPTNDVSTNSFHGVPIDTTSLLYTNIDEGILIPNDTDFLIGSGYPSNGLYRSYVTIIDLNNLTINPTFVSLNIRYSGGIQQDETQYFNTTSVVSIGDYNNNNYIQYTLPVNSGGTFKNISYDITNFYKNISTITSTIGIAFSDWCNYTPSGTGFSVFNTTPKMKISAIELLFSGNYLIKNSCPLYIKGSQPTGNSVPLYTLASSQLKSGCDMYLETSKFTGSIDLFINSFGLPINSGTTLITKVDSTITSQNINTNLYTINKNVALDSVPLYLNTSNIDKPFNTLPLFISGPVPKSIDSFNGRNITTIFTANNFGNKNNNTNLIISNVIPSSSTMPIFLNAYGLGSGNLTASLYTAQLNNITNNSGNTTLFLNNGNNYIKNNVNTFISAVPQPVASGYGPSLITYAILNTVIPTENIFLINPIDSLLINPLDYFLLGPGTLATSIDALYKSSPLYIAGSVMNSSMNLFINSETKNVPNSSINLYLANTSNIVNNNTPIITYNNAQSINNTANLFVGGYGINDGFYVAAAGVSLFLNRSTTGASNNTTLIVKAPSAINAETSLYAMGGTFLNSGATLIMPVVKGTGSSGTFTYVHGF